MPDITPTFDTNESLETIEVAIDGPETGTLSEADFTETDNGDDTYSYEGSFTVTSDGDYTATLQSATDANGNDGASGQSATVTVDTTGPVISNYSVSVTTTSS